MAKFTVDMHINIVCLGTYTSSDLSVPDEGKSGKALRTQEIIKRVVFNFFCPCYLIKFHKIILFRSKLNSRTTKRSSALITEQDTHTILALSYIISEVIPCAV